MKEVRLTLGFGCCLCGQPITVTLDCSGPIHGADPSRLVAKVGIPCPDCHRVNLLYFDPTGTVHAVEPYREQRLAPEPSLN